MYHYVTFTLQADARVPAAENGSAVVKVWWITLSSVTSKCCQYCISKRGKIEIPYKKKLWVTLNPGKNIFTSYSLVLQLAVQFKDMEPLPLELPWESVGLPTFMLHADQNQANKNLQSTWVNFLFNFSTNASSTWVKMSFFLVSVKDVSFIHIFCLSLVFLHASLYATLLLYPPKLSSTCTLLSSQSICKHHSRWRYNCVILVILSNTTETNK